MKVETYRIFDWEEAEHGLLIMENDEWILVKHIPVDYVIDGYRLYKKEFLEERSRGDKEKQIEKVLSLKKVATDPPEGFKFANTLGLLKWIEKKYGLFEFQDFDESQLYYGKINSVEDNWLILDVINQDGFIEDDPEDDGEFDLDEIRVVCFESDYHISLKLLWENNKKGHK